MLQCWQEKPSSRPSFTALRNTMWWLPWFSELYISLCYRYGVMLQCWQEKPSSRPSFTALRITMWWLPLFSELFLSLLQIWRYVTVLAGKALKQALVYCPQKYDGEDDWGHIGLRVPELRPGRKQRLLHCIFPRQQYRWLHLSQEQLRFRLFKHGEEKAIPDMHGRSATGLQCCSMWRVEGEQVCAKHDARETPRLTDGATGPWALSNGIQH